VTTVNCALEEHLLTYLLTYILTLGVERDTEMVYTDGGLWRQFFVAIISLAVFVNVMV